MNDSRSHKPKVVVKQDKNGTWRGGDGKFTAPITKPQPPQPKK